MNELTISDTVLASAAISVRDAMMNSMPAPSECEHEFSEEFHKKMEPVFAKDKRRRTSRIIAQRVAAVFLAPVIGLGTWMAVDTND